METVAQAFGALVQLPGLQPCLCGQSTTAAAEDPWEELQILLLLVTLIQPHTTKTK